MRLFWRNDFHETPSLGVIWGKLRLSQHSFGIWPLEDWNLGGEWFQIFWIFTSKIEEGSHFDLRIFFNWVGSTTNQLPTNVS